MFGAAPARKAAFDILLAVERGRAHSDELLRGKAVDALSAADRNLATALVLGVLRWQIWLDAQVQQLLTRPKAKLEAEVRIALRLGAFQLFLMERIPARAAIDESVELAKISGHRFASGMVNAVLRKLAVKAASPDAFDEPSAAAKVHPAWLVKRWAAMYGAKAAQAICAHGQRQAVPTLRIADAEAEWELAAAGVDLEPAELLTRARRVVSGDVSVTRAWREGRVRFQDEGSQLIAELAAVSVGQTAETILDACAAPGGKTLILAERHPAARIVACEASSARFESLRQRLATHADRVECRLADATELAENGTFDLVLADVPCSGTGTLGRNPEIRHRLRVEDLARHAEKQRAILHAALRAVRVGGRVVYSTCSLEPEENEQAIAATLEEVREVRVVPVQPVMSAVHASGIFTDTGTERLMAACTAEGLLRLMPGEFATDGFFLALMERLG